MKEIRQEITQHTTRYEAVDGTIFTNKEECKKYELTAECLLNYKYCKLVIKKTSEYDLSGFGSNDDKIEVVKLKSEKDIDTVIQLWVFYNNWLNNDKDSINEGYKLCKKALDEDDVLFIYKGYEEDNFGIKGTRNQLIERLKNLDKEKNEETKV